MQGRRRMQQRCRLVPQPPTIPNNHFIAQSTSNQNEGKITEHRENEATDRVIWGFNYRAVFQIRWLGRFSRRHLLPQGNFLL